LYKCYWALPVLSLLGSIPAELEAISYCLIWDWIHFLSPFMTCRAMVEVSQPASTWGPNQSHTWTSFLYNSDVNHTDNIASPILLCFYVFVDRLCGLVVRVPDCRPRDPRFDFRRYYIF
jgi:hypothetical protein